MLVIISDLHLTDGSSGETIKAGAFRIFRERLSDLAYDASWRSNGRYQPIESIDLVLLGDVLDPIRSTRWLADEHGAASPARPWDDPHSQPFVDKLDEITTAILENNTESLAVLRSFAREQAITIPPATPDGKMAKVSRDPDDPERAPVEVRIHYLVGNHDWFYHLPGLQHNRIRSKIVEAIGLANDPNTPFWHDPLESDQIQALYEPYRLLARHGDIYDSFNYEGDRDQASLGDAVVVELLNRFPTEVYRRMGDQLPEECLLGLKEVDNVRPLLVVPIWVNSLLNRTLSDRRQIEAVKDIWDDLADDFLNLPFVRSRDKALDFFDNVDKLEWALKFAKGLSFQSISQVTSWLQEKLGLFEVTHHRSAYEEPAFLNKKARFVVHGHTHHYEIVPLDSTELQGARLDQMYLNSGTWRRVHKLARYNPREQEFMGYHMMTYVAFFKEDERRGRPFEVWTGGLGV